MENKIIENNQRFDNSGLLEEKSNARSEVNEMIKNEHMDMGVISEKENYKLCAQVLVDGTTKIVEGIVFFLVDKRTNMPCIGNEKPMEIKKSALLKEMQYGILSKLKNFDINLTEQDLKVAKEMCLKFIEDNDKKITVSGSLSIAEAYQSMIETAREIADEEVKKNIASEERTTFIDNEYVCISDKIFSDIAGEIGYTVKRFCDGIRFLEKCSGIKILGNTPGRNTWTTTQNKHSVRYYRFKIVNLGSQQEKCA